MGLLAGSTATIIGAMIVAPLMGPITGIAFSLSVGNRRLLKRSGVSLLMGCLLTVATAYIFAHTFDLNNLNPEITSRIKPTLIDLVIALAAGAAGSFAKTRRGVADALPGGCDRSCSSSTSQRHWYRIGSTFRYGYVWGNYSICH